MGKFIRVILAGVLGGVVVFCCGAFAHVMLDLEERAVKGLANDADVRQTLGKKNPAGLYRLPPLPPKVDGKLTDEQKKEWTSLYKEGPSGLLVIHPTGEEPMGPEQLGGEFATNLLAALIAAFIVSSLAPGTSYPVRWFIVLLLGAFTWISTSASFALWYRFPWDFILDGLYCSLMEWGVAGLLIAAIARPASPQPPTTV